MPIKKLIPVNSIIIQLIICSGILSLIAFETCGRNYRSIIYTLPIVIPLILFMIIRHHCNNLTLFLLLNIVTIACSTIMFKNSFLRFGAVIIMLVLFVNSYKIKTSDVKNVSETPSIVFAAFFVFLAFLGSGILRIKIYGTVYSCYLIIFFIFEYIQMNICGVWNFISAKSHIHTLPAKKIQNLSVILVVLLCILTVLGALFFGNHLFVNTVNDTNTLFIYGLGKFLRAVFPDNGNPDLAYYDFTSKSESEIKMEPDTPNILNLIWNIIGVILLTITVVICAIIIYKAVIHMIKKFSGITVSKNGDETEFILQPVKYTTLSKKQKNTSDIKLKNNDKIRAIYFKTLKKAAPKRHIFNVSQTPVELKESIIDSQTSPLTGETSITKDTNLIEKSAEFTAMYEAARYGNLELNSDDIKYARQLANTIASAKN